MYDSSPCTDSCANAARRCHAVVIVAIACRTSSSVLHGTHGPKVIR
jgi:hypothetical protein